MKIAFLGLGAMGWRMSERLCHAGHEVTVWNRTCPAALPKGATWAATPSLAATDAEIVISMVRDDIASENIWLGEDGALSAMPANAIGVECSTVSLPHTLNLNTAFQRAGKVLIDAPLAGSRPQAEAGALIFFVGGEASAVNQVHPIFEVMGNAVHHVGDLGAGITTKLMVNALFGAQLAIMGELIGFVCRTAYDRTKIIEAITATPVSSPAATLAAGAMLNGNFAPAFPIDLAAKDFTLITKSAQSLSTSLPLTGACGAVYADAAKEGYGADNITGIVQRYLERTSAP